MPFQLTFCQQAGNQHQKNQDALFNGKAVYQWQLKNAESYLLDNEKVIFGVADGVSSHPRNHLASMYNGLTDCIVADFDADDFRIHIAEFQLKKGESILLCSDGLHDQLAPKAIQAIWDGYGSPSHRLQICRKMVKMHRLYDDFSAVICEIVT